MGDIAIPYLFAALMAVEYGYNALRGNGYQTPRNSAVSLMVAVPHFATLAILPVIWVVLYRAVEGIVPWRLAADAWWVWPLGIVVMDFAAYWMHRYHHALNLTWGIHSVHHSSDEYTITTGGRSSLAEPVVNIVSGAYLILVLPALTGLPLAAAALGWLVKDTWGFAVHTRNVRRLGVLEAVMATRPTIASITRSIRSTRTITTASCSSSGTSCSGRSSPSSTRSRRRSARTGRR